jgi:putative ABC transport system permease protein
VGQVVQLSAPGGLTPYRIVGLVSDAVYRNPREGFVPTLYVPIAQRREVWADVTLTVAAAPGQRAAVQHALVAALRDVDPRTSFTFRTFDELARATVVQERLVALLSSFFGGLALLLAAVGLYGVVSHAVSRRRTEFGVRMALGADSGRILRLVLRHVGGMIILGLVAGTVLSLWLAGFVQTLLFSMPARDPLTFGAAILVLLAIGLVAAWLPARRAASLDPAAVLREG